MTRPSTMPPQQHFAQIPRAEIQRSVFDRSHGHKTTFDGGFLIPIYVDEALPGDTMKLKMQAFARLATPLTAVMDNMRLTTFFFAVPNRLLWTDWQRFNGAQDDPGDSTDFLVPQVTAPGGGWGEQSMGDYFGVPTKVDPLPVNALWFRAYNLVWNEWFRSEDLQDRATRLFGTGPDSGASYPLKRRGKRHDYFTSCLPFPQKGDDVTLPLGTSAPVVDVGGGASPTWATIGGTSIEMSLLANSTNTVPAWGAQADVNGAVRWENTALEADLSTATAATINQIREAFQIQRLLERDARGGTRYTEIVKSHFGVTSPDARLNRPEYLGGGTQVISVTAVPQTSSTDATTPQGNIAAFGVSHGSHGFNKSFTEHCTIIGLVSVQADLTYQQGLNRMWSRRTRFDYAWPSLAHLGEQEVLNKEIYAYDAPELDNVFGFQERFAEYRYKPSMVTGRMRSNASASTDIWHLAQDFGTLPVLDDAFIQDNPPIDRIIAVATEPQFLFDAYIDLKHARPLPTYGVPGLIDHF